MPDGARPGPTLVSVVLPVRDGGDLLEEQLAALAQQDYAGAWELVVADNGSTDGTPDRAARWASRFPVALRVADVADRLGCGGARNGGADAARGDLLAFCDADDVVEPTWLTALVEAARRADLVGGRLRTDVVNAAEVVAWRGAAPGGDLPVALGWRPYATGANFAVWTEVHRSLGGFRDGLTAAEDVDYSWRAQLAGRTVAAAPSAVVHYRYRPGLRATARQYAAYGASEPALFRSFRQHGLPRRPPARALYAAAWLVKHLPDLARDRTARGQWVREAAYGWGRLRGSLRTRAWYV